MNQNAAGRNRNGLHPAPSVTDLARIERAKSDDPSEFESRVNSLGNLCLDS